MSDNVEEEHLRSRQQRYGSSRRKSQEPSQGKRWAAELKDWLVTTVVVFVLMSLLNIFVFNISTVKGQSMQPTLWEGEKLFINKIVLSFANPRRGDIIVLHDPSIGDSRKEYLVKRVIGIPGDTVEVRNHQLYVNGKMKVEPYIDTAIQDPDFAPITIDEEGFFVMGDNRHAGASKDSRYFGFVTEEIIVGKAAFIWWPFSKMNSL